MTNAAWGDGWVPARRVPPCEPVNLSHGRKENFDLIPEQGPTTTRRQTVKAKRYKLSILLWRWFGVDVLGPKGTAE